MKKIILRTLYIVPLYIALAFTACNGNTPENPQEQPLNPAELVHTMWRADSVFISGEVSPGPHFIVDIFAADKAVLNGDTVSYHFEDKHLIIESREMDVEVSAYTGNTAKLKITKDGIEMYVSKLPEKDIESMIMEHQASDFYGTWKLAYFTYSNHTPGYEMEREGTNPGTETWEFKADGSCVYYNWLHDETATGTWECDPYQIKFFKNPAVGTVITEDEPITVQPLTPNWMCILRSPDGWQYYYWWFVRVQ